MKSLMIEKVSWRTLEKEFVSKNLIEPNPKLDWTLVELVPLSWTCLS